MRSWTGGSLLLALILVGSAEARAQVAGEALLDSLATHAPSRPNRPGIEATRSDVYKDLIMRVPAVGALLALLAVAPLSAQAAPARVFREITVAPAGRLALGEPLAGPGRFTQVRTGLYELRPTDGPAKSIMVAVDSSNVVRMIAVVYAAGHDYAEARAARVRALGTPEEIDEVEEGGVIKGAAWEDSTTYFAVVHRRFTDSLPDVVELLRDR